MKIVFLILMSMMLAHLEAQQKSKDQIVIGQRFKLYSKILNEEKEIYISLPHKYDEREQNYPVVFVLEAEYLFEATRSIGNFMARRSHMPQSIIVGLANGSYKKRNELTLIPHGGKTDQYLEFFRKELIPHIESNYRANQHRTIIGLSPSTGLVLEAFWSQPDLFRGYISLSTHLLWNPEKGVEMIDKLIDTINDPNHPKASIYLGTADGDIIGYKEAEKTYAQAQERLRAIKPRNVSFRLDVLEDEEHYMMSLAGIRKGFGLIYPHSKMINPLFEGALNPAEDIKKRYETQSEAYGFKVYPVEDGHNPGDHLVGLATSMSRFGRHSNQQITDLLQLSIDYYPNSAQLYIMLAEILGKEGNTMKAIEMGEKALKLAAKYHPDMLPSLRDKLKTIKD